MTIQNYLLVNQSTNIVDNSIDWDGNLDTWQPPNNYLLLIQSATPALVWGVVDGDEEIVLIEKIGAGGIGFTWNGSVLTTNQPQPTQ
jgi:hypothetical protein